MSLYNKASVQSGGSDNVYVNLEIYNSTNQLINADFNQTFNQNVLERPSDYELSIVRFSSPGTNIPIFIFNTTSNYYTVTLSDATGNYQASLALIREDFRDPASTNYIFSYQNFVNMVNVAFAKAYAALLVGNPGTTAPSPPFMTFNPTEDVLRISYPQTGYSKQVFSATGATDSAGTKVYMNASLFGYFESFPSRYYGGGQLAGKDVQLLVYDDGDNNLVVGVAGTNGVYKSTTNPNLPMGPYYMMEQDYSTLYLWNDFSSIVITSNTIPVNKEYLPKINGQVNVQPILTDFQPNVQSGPDAKSTLQYLPSGEYRVIDLVSDAPLNQFQFSVYWTDHTQTLYPLKLSPSDYVSIKILFRKKGSPFSKPVQDVRIVDNLVEAIRLNDNQALPVPDMQSLGYFGNTGTNIMREKIKNNKRIY
jgi:hypothetical protein